MWGARGISPLFLIVVAAWYARASLVDSCSDALSAESGQCWELGEGRPLGILVRQVPSLVHLPPFYLGPATELIVSCPELIYFESPESDIGTHSYLPFYTTLTTTDNWTHLLSSWGRIDC